jgi:hypothetical protein
MSAAVAGAKQNFCSCSKYPIETVYSVQDAKTALQQD